ncbi:hypothetical protein BDV96DRAFT_657298 [Lophiotrema nucula]|uniref:Uncharacterized protein n=1 Tax=Lophiotrema nucula TaxID=690887 RepID=A0A6A5ZDA8_9PLEO|nr:hypothetical protein BDV96DRAFT_657298 [Lophiotrema nucula]
MTRIWTEHGARKKDDYMQSLSEDEKPLASPIKGSTPSQQLTQAEKAYDTAKQEARVAWSRAHPAYVDDHCKPTADGYDEVDLIESDDYVDREFVEGWLQSIEKFQDDSSLVVPVVESMAGEVFEDPRWISQSSTTDCHLEGGSRGLTRPATGRSDVC